LSLLKVKSIYWYEIVIAIPVSIIGIYLGVTLKDLETLPFIMKIAAYIHVKYTNIRE